MALIATALVAALLMACGSNSDSSSSTEATTAGRSATGTTASNGGGTQSNSQAQNGTQGQKSGQSPNDSQNSQSPSQQSSGGGGAGSQNVKTPLKVSGGGAEQFRSNGGDNSIQEFGKEGDESELQEVAEIVHSFYVARAEEKWDTACSYLSKSNIEQLEQLASRAPQHKNVDCGTVLKAFTQTLPAAVEREITTVDAGSFRHDGEQGFLIYYGAGHQTYSMPLKAEGGTWKVTALIGTTLG
ncbi:MAG: hypothetical protein QOF85_1733 [Solirubrobacterales bacterium]|nr:hypothetical protein [Solirubrobacterales bacterium]